MTTQVFVYTMNHPGQLGSWSRYELPEEVDYYTQLGADIYLRCGDLVVKVSEDASTDAVLYAGDVTDQYFESLLWWPYLDFGAPGSTKMLIGFDFVGWGSTASIEVGYDQRNFAVRTTAYEIAVDTLPGGIIPLPMAAPSMSMRITYDSADGTFEWLATNLYLQDFRMAS